MNRFNQWLARKVTNGVSTMWCAYAFCILALLGLKPALKPNGEGLVAWVAQTFIQLVLLSVIMVGQKIESQKTTDAVKEHLTTNHKMHMLELDSIKKHLGIGDNTHG
jgi:hypothetical protein